MDEATRAELIDEAVRRKGGVLIQYARRHGLQLLEPRWGTCWPYTVSQIRKEFRRLYWLRRLKEGP